MGSGRERVDLVGCRAWCCSELKVRRHSASWGQGFRAQEAPQRNHWQDRSEDSCAEGHLTPPCRLFKIRPKPPDFSSEDFRKKYEF